MIGIINLAAIAWHFNHITAKIVFSRPLGGISIEIGKENSKQNVAVLLCEKIQRRTELLEHARTSEQLNSKSELLHLLT